MPPLSANGRESIKRREGEGAVAGDELLDLPQLIEVSKGTTAPKPGASARASGRRKTQPAREKGGPLQIKATPRERHMGDPHHKLSPDCPLFLIESP
ncbi:hypothetical protein CGRA01v4_07134 [Colletotrichum graminicola]|nr:hypothetical protein CGRA01v4_07134 [Colletotrichum graminicola]